MVSQRFHEVAAERDAARAACAQIISDARERIDAKDAEIARLKASEADLRAKLSAAERLVSERLSEKLDDDDAPGILEPGQSPLNDVASWQRSQLGQGGGMFAPILRFRIQTPPDNR